MRTASKLLLVSLGVSVWGCTAPSVPAASATTEKPAPTASVNPNAVEPVPSAAPSEVPAASGSPSPDTEPGARPGEFDKARIAMAALGAKDVEAGVLRWQLSHGATCPSVDDLVTARLILPTRSNDPWGEKYRVTCNGDGTTVVTSAGPDKKPGTSDDVGSSEQR